MHPIPLFLIGTTLIAAHYMTRLWQLSLPPARKFPPVTRDHHLDCVDHPNVVPYSKFRARRRIQEKDIKLKKAS